MEGLGVKRMEGEGGRAIWGSRGGWQCCGGVGGLMSDSSRNQNVLSSCILMSLDVAGEIASHSNLFNIFCVFALFI